MRLSKLLARWFRTGSSPAENQLLHRCAGDLGQTERLIRYELSRRPQLSRAAACDAAVERWNRDR